MRYWQATAALAGLACVLFGLSTLEPDWVTRAEQRSVAIATLPCSTALQSMSSGFVIGDRTVVTVAHAIHETRDFAVLDRFGHWHRGTVLRLDLERDIAVVHVANLRATDADVSSAGGSSAAWRDVAVEMLDGAASGSAQAEILRRVRISTQHVGDRSQTNQRLGYEVALDIDPGDSGAAVLDADDQLIGLVFARSTRRPGIAWVTAAQEIRLEAEPLPTWDCGPANGAELELRRPRPKRLAG